MKNEKLAALSARISETNARIRASKNEMQELAERAGNREFTAGEQERWDRTMRSVEKLEHEAAAATAEWRDEMTRHVESGHAHVEYSSPQPIERHGGGRLGEVRGRAIGQIERLRDTTDAVKSTLVDLVERDGSDRDLVAAWTRSTTDPAYLTAFAKILRDPQRGHLEWDAREVAAFQDVREVQRALSVGSNSFAVPAHLDPSVIITSAGSSNPLRQIARVVTMAVGSTWNGITSAGVSASFDSENSEVSDDSPTLAAASVPIHTARAFVAASLEMAQDSNGGLDAQVLELFADAKDTLEGAKFSTGSGTGEPKGIWTALAANTNVQITSTTAATIGMVDIHALYDALPARFRQRARWLMNPKWALAVKELGTAVSSSFIGDLTAPPSSYMLGKPVIESDDAPEVVTTTALDSRIIVGDLQNFVVVDRLGATLEYIPTVFGATNGRPIGARGWFMYWRTGSGSVNDTAFRLLVDKTSA